MQVAMPMRSNTVDKQPNFPFPLCSGTPEVVFDWMVFATNPSKRKMPIMGIHFSRRSANIRAPIVPKQPETLPGEAGNAFVSSGANAGVAELDISGIA